MQCLDKSPDRRPSAVQLLQSEFVAGNGDDVAALSEGLRLVLGAQADDSSEEEDTAETQQV